jgi:hypothetical protein
MRKHNCFLANYAASTGAEVIRKGMSPNTQICDIFRIEPFMWHVHKALHDYYQYTHHRLKYLMKKTHFIAVDITDNTFFWKTRI